MNGKARFGRILDDAAKLTAAERVKLATLLLSTVDDDPSPPTPRPRDSGATGGRALTGDGNDDATAGRPEYLSAPQLAELTGTPASTWRYWAHIGHGPPSLKLGRSRVWRRTDVQA